MTNRFFILTGGPGSGKTTLIDELKRRGILCIEEVARKIIQEEMALGGSALAGPNLNERIKKMITLSIETYKEAEKTGGLILFDRGVLDYFSYANRMNTPISKELHKEIFSLVYNKKVFITPPWQEIYCTDTERQQTFEEAVVVYQTCFNVYAENGYEVIELPKVDVKARADFMISEMNA